VWLRYAECLNALDDKLGAIAAYEKVVELVPNHFSARVSLSALHQQLGRPDDALRALLPQPLVTGTTHISPYCVYLINQWIQSVQLGSL